MHFFHYFNSGTRNLEVVDLLLRAGVDVNQKNMLGMNALLLVSGYGNDQLVKMILDVGADPNTTNDFGHTALHLAVVGQRDQIKKLKEMGVAEAFDTEKVGIYNIFPFMLCSLKSSFLGDPNMPFT